MAADNKRKFEAEVSKYNNNNSPLIINIFTLYNKTNSYLPILNEKHSTCVFCIGLFSCQCGQVGWQCCKECVRRYN